jgi:hypothetical protein
MKSDRETLVEVLEEARALLARPDNDFAWSSFEGSEEAIAEIDDHIARVRRGDGSKRVEMRALFGPTGPIQEVSISSGWSEAFLKIAQRFDVVQDA